jgi:hypothetical protein
MHNESVFVGSFVFSLLRKSFHDSGRLCCGFLEAAAAALAEAHHQLHSTMHRASEMPGQRARESNAPTKPNPLRTVISMYVFTGSQRDG